MRAHGGGVCVRQVLVDVNWRSVFWPEGQEQRARQDILQYLQQVR